VDHSKMTEFLLKNNANIDTRTFGDEQAAIHYAAKNGAAQSLKILLGYHANIDSLDASKKTPLQVCDR
jgi:ankyrin repeat protein